MSLSSVRALVVDAERPMRQHLVSILKSLGIAACDEADSVEAARAAHAARGHPLILLDPNLTGESGWAWLKELRRGGDDAVVILVGDQVTAELANKANVEGADGYLRKDMKREALRDELTQTIGSIFGR